MKIKIMDKCGSKMNHPGLSLQAENEAEGEQLKRVKRELDDNTSAYWSGWVKRVPASSLAAPPITLTQI